MTNTRPGHVRSGLQHGSSCSRRRRSSRGAATSWRGSGRSCRGFGSTRSIDSRPTRGAPRWRTSSEGARSSSSTTSCSGPTTRRAVRPARRSRTGSTASPSTWPTTTSRCRRCRGRRSRSCRRTSGGWDGRFRGRLRTAATSTSTSASGSPRSNSARGPSNTTTGARSRRRGPAGPGSCRRGAGRRDRGHDRNRRGHVHARAAGHERVRARGRRRLPHLFRLCARTRRPLGHVPVARPRPEGTQRDGRLVAPPRRVQRAERHRRIVSAALLFTASAAITIVRCTSMSAMGGMPMPGGWRCRWRGCGCPDRRGPAPRRRSSACGS